jgi:hypothetical protein
VHDSSMTRIRLMICISAELELDDSKLESLFGGRGILSDDAPGC